MGQVALELLGKPVSGERSDQDFPNREGEDGRSAEILVIDFNGLLALFTFFRAFATWVFFICR